MFMRRMILTTAVAAAACVAPTLAQAETYVVVTPPGVTYSPEPVYEPMPAPRAGYSWMPGYWQNNGDRQVWIAGHWVVDRDYYVRRERAREEEHHWWRRHHDDD